MIYKKLRNDFIKFWEESIKKNITEKKGNKLRTYKDLKKKFEMENFLKLDIDISDISNFVRLRISNSILKIEKGRHRKNRFRKQIMPLM